MTIEFKAVEGRSVRTYLLLVFLLLLMFAGLLSTYRMYEHGLYLSGMTNRIPWGLQIILAVFYIGLSAGSLVISSLYGIFGKIEYKPFARTAVYLALLFLVAALLSILCDLGRLDRLLETTKHFNFLSMFSINPFLYITYILICIVYLWAMFSEKERFVKVISLVAVLWAIGVHSGTGAIFGYVPRELFQSPLLPPSFIAAALSSGTALMILVILSLFKLTGRYLDMRLIRRLGRLLAVFVVIVMYFVLVENAYRLYIPETHEAGHYFLFEGVHSVIFWVGMIAIGSLVPAVLLLNPRTGKSIPWIAFSAALVVLGVICERYLIVIPGQTRALDLFPNMDVTGTVLTEGAVTYHISFYEVLQALGILGLIGFLFVAGLKIFRMLPTEARLPTEAGSEEPAEA